MPNSVLLELNKVREGKKKIQKGGGKKENLFLGWKPFIVDLVVWLEAKQGDVNEKDLL